MNFRDSGCRTDLNTGSAMGALALIDFGKRTVHCNRARRTSLLTALAADTADITTLPGLHTGPFVLAENGDS